MLQWAQRYHGTDTENNHPIGLEVDSLGNSYVTGAASIFNENSNFVTIKYNSSGVQQWIDLYNGPGSNSIDWPIGIKLDNNKNVIVCGHSESAGFGSDDYVLIKYNNSGTRLWVARYNSSGSFADTPYDMTVDNAGNIYVTGTSYNGTRNDALTIKYNSNGDSVWARRFNSAAVNTIGSSVVVDNSGSVYVSVQSGTTLMLLKYNSSGTQQWYVTGSTGCYNIKSQNDEIGNIYISCTRTWTVPPGDDFYICKYNTSGVLQWNRQYNGIGNNHDVVKGFCLSENTLFVTGYSAGISSNSDFLTIKLTTDGDTLWSRRYNGADNGVDDPYSLAADNVGNVYVTGSSYNSAGLEMLTIKYGGNGDLLWEIRYNGGGRVIRRNPTNNNIFIFGGAQDVFPYSELVTVKYDQLVGGISVPVELPFNNFLSQNYPNPFNPITNIKYGIEKSSKVTLKVFDINGKLLTVLVDQLQKEGEHQVIWNAANFASGFYFYELVTNDKREIRKMILLK